MKDIVIQLLTKELSGKLTEQEIQRLIEIPPSDEMGDFAFPCFSLSRIFRKNPAIIADELSKSLALPPEIEKITAVSGYLNFFIKREIMAQKVISEAGKESFGKQNRAQRIVVEFSSPNSNKPLHLGHLRNMSIGESVSRILQFCGNSVFICPLERAFPGFYSSAEIQYSKPQ